MVRLNALPLGLARDQLLSREHGCLALAVILTGERDVSLRGAIRNFFKAAASQHFPGHAEWPDMSSHWKSPADSRPSLCEQAMALLFALNPLPAGAIPEDV